MASEWHCDGPDLPVEFARVGDECELATALCADAAPLPVLWAWLSATELETACAALRQREGIPPDRHDGIGSLVVSPQAAGPLSRWAAARGIEAVIWTALPPRIDGVEGRVPSVTAAIAYLRGLERGRLEHARAYFEAVPRQIATAYRREISFQLGWSA